MERLTLPGKVDSLHAIAQYVLAAAAAAGLDKKASYKLRLAVEEIATNIIRYGYQEGGREGVVELWADMDEKTLTIYIEDTAPRFDPFEKLALEESQLDLPLSARQIGGLGVYLAIKGVDKFVYERFADRNRNAFMVNRVAV